MDFTDTELTLINIGLNALNRYYTLSPKVQSEFKTLKNKLNKVDNLKRYLIDMSETEDYKSYLSGTVLTFIKLYEQKNDPALIEIASYFLNELRKTENNN